MSSCTVFNAHITDQVIQLSNLPRIASGSKEALQIHCNFCGKWEGCGKAAVFYRDDVKDEDGKVKSYLIPVVNDLVTVPWEVLVDEGHFWMGFMGQDDLTRTTEVIRVEVVKGALTVATATPQDPTPDIYQQILAAHGKLETRFNAAIAVPGSFDPAAVFEAESADGHVNVTIRSNGFAAHATINVSGMGEVLSPTGTKSYNTGILIPKSYVAIHPTLATCTSAVYGSVDDLVVHMSGPIGYKDDPGAGRVEITLNASATSVPSFASYSVTYVLANPSLPELTDIRAIHPDGLLYDTAASAVRTELDNVDRRVESNIRELASHNQRISALEQGGGGTGGGGGGSITVDAELSDTSTNPVQNKVITAVVAEAGEAIANIGGAVSTLQTGIGELAKKTLPNVTAEDNGKILRVVDGAWAAVTLPAAEDAAF